jgi:predicted MFS family arabinose efflux permease
VPDSSPRADRTILLLSCAAFFGGAALRICDALIPRLAHDFDRTPGVAGRVVISFSVAYGLMQVFFGPLGDRFGKARVVCIAVAGCALGALACSFAPGFDALVALRTAWGVAAAGVIPVAIAWVGDAVPYEERQATLARLMTGTLSGMLGGQLAGGLFADSSFGWRGAFLSLSAGYALVAVLLFRSVRGSPAGHASVDRIAFIGPLMTVLRTPWARVVLLAVAVEGIFLLGPLAYLPAYLHLRHGLSLAAASALVALYAVGGLAYAITARRIVASWGERKMVFVGGMLVAAAFLALWIAPWWGLAGPLALVLGFGTYLYHNTLQTHATQMTPAVRGTAVAVFASCLFAGQAAGVSLAGTALDRWGFAPLLVVPAAAMGLAGWWFARALARRAQA